MTNNNTHKQITTGLLNPSKNSVFHKLFTNPNPQSKKALKCFLEAILQEQISNIEIQLIPTEGAFSSKKIFPLNKKKVWQLPLRNTVARRLAKIAFAIFPFGLLPSLLPATQQVS